MENETKQGTKRWVFYHADLDGRCAGAIAANYYGWPNVTLREIDYGDPFPWDEIKPDDSVVMVDFCLQPIGDMHRLLKACHELIWIDHHMTALHAADEIGFSDEVKGLRRVGKAGCELTYEYYLDGTRNFEVPRAVRLLGRYDVWDHTDLETLPFQWGMRAIRYTLPTNQILWESLLLGDTDHDSRALVDKIINDGHAILRFRAADDIEYCKAYAFEAEFHGLPAVVVNRGRGNSQLFESIYDSLRHKLMIVFIMRPDGQWSVSLYSDHDDVNCGALARQQGGGGHKGAAGYQCSDVPVIRARNGDCLVL